MGSLPHVVEDCLGIIQVYSDGSISRSDNINFPMKLHEDNGSSVWKDILYEKKHNLHLRLYKPSKSTGKLPIVYFFHGGGFCIGSRTWPNIHTYGLLLASSLQTIVVAPDYRLGPEDKLPAAIDDAVTAIKWLQHQAENGGTDADEWLRNNGEVDFERVFVIGDSSGGNLAHHLAVKFGCGSPELAPVRVRGYVLMAPFFGGTVRTKSEAEGPPEQFLTIDILDCFWRLSLPNGQTADSPVANPFGPSSPNLDSVKLNPMLVLVGGSEIMKDRIMEYAKRLKEMGKDIDYFEFKGKHHGEFVNDPFSEEAKIVLQKINLFMSKNSI